MKIIFWGTGNTAKKYLESIKKLSNQFELVAFTDSKYSEGLDDKLLWEDYRVVSPQKIPDLNIDYLCILSVWEWEIRQKIYDEKLFDLSKIVSFHEIFLMDSLGSDLENAYDKLLQTMHPLQKDSAKKWRTYEYLKKNYSYVLCDRKYWNVNTDRKVDFENKVRPVWVLWLQGFEQAPELVKVCVHSLERVLEKEEQICLLDKSNLFDYIDLPDYIVEKWEKGIIDNTKFSNLVRLRLLNTYGGIWIDATVYFTGDKLPGYIKDSDLFMYNIYRDWRKHEEPLIAASWLIAAQPKNEMLMLLEALHNEYWKKEDRVIHYTIIHIFWTIVVERFPEQWDQVETVLRDSSRLLSRELACKFDAERFKHLKQMSDIHKLSYKISYAEGGEDSFWSKLCENEGRSYNKDYTLRRDTQL